LKTSRQGFLSPDNLELRPPATLGAQGLSSASPELRWQTAAETGSHLLLVSNKALGPLGQMLPSTIRGGTLAYWETGGGSALDAQGV
jgi:hypothetical protein